MLDKQKSTSHSLYRATSIVSLMTMLSRSLGFVRDMCMASLFGATFGCDAFLVAFKIPNFMRALFADGSFSQAIVPFLTEYRTNHSEEEAKELIKRILSWFIGVFLLITLICELVAPLIVILFAPGFLHDPVRFKLALHMLRITFPYIFCISITAYLGAVLNSYGRFALSSFTPVLLNIILIVAAKYFAPFFDFHEEILAWGVFVAGLVQLLFQLPFLLRYRLLPIRSWEFKNKNIKKIAGKFLPALLGVSVVQMSLLINTFFASFLTGGSISWLYYADRLTFFPLGVFGVALAVVVLPNLSALHARSLPHEFSVTLDWALRLILMISIPAMVGLIIVSGPLTACLFRHGQFSSFDVSMTQKAVVAFAFGLPAFMAIKILAAGFYAKQNIKAPLRIAIYAVVLNVIFNFCLIFPLSHTGLALGTSLSAMVNASLLVIMLKKLAAYKPLPGWKKFLLQLFFANGMMSMLLIIMIPSTGVWLTWGLKEQISNLLLLILGAVIVYFGCLWICGLRKKHLMAESFYHVQNEMFIR